MILIFQAEAFFIYIMMFSSLIQTLIVFHLKLVQNTSEILSKSFVKPFCKLWYIGKKNLYIESWDAAPNFRSKSPNNAKKKYNIFFTQMILLQSSGLPINM